MPTYELSGPDGGTYNIDAPDEHAAVSALGQVTAGAASEAKAAPVQAEPQSALQSIREAIHGPTRLLESGVMLGLGDRARAAISSALGIGPYGDSLKSEQGETDRYREEHPIAATAAEGVGNVVAPLGAIGAASRATSMGGKILAGAGAGGVIGALQGGLSSRDWTDAPQLARDTGTGAGIGAVVGGAIPVAGRVIGAGYRAAADLVAGRAEGMSRAASGHLVDAMAADGPQAVRDRIQRLGDDAMLADAGPAFLGKAQGASLNSDEGRSVLQSALTARNEGTNQRIMGDVNRALGPAEDPQTVTNAIRARRTEVDSQAYPAALDNAPPVRTGAILTDLDDMIPQAPVGSMEHRALSNLREMMMTTERRPLLDAHGYPQYDRLGNERFQDVPISQNDAGVLHKIKGELDNVIEYDAPGLGVPAGALQRQQGALKQMRFRVNQALENQVPGYADANRASASLARRGDAVELGTQYLGSGKTTASPGRFADEFTRLEPGEQIAFAKGSRGNIERALGTKANDLQALRTELQGEGGWNTAKIGAVHGQDAADELAASVDRNLKFRDTHNKVVENSQTAQRTAASNAMKPQPPGEVPLIGPGTTGVGLVAGGAKKVLNAAYGALRPDATRSYGEVANILTEQGAARDARIQAIVDALDRRRGNAIAAPIAGGRAALIAAIGANGYARTNPRRNRRRP